MSRAAKIDRFAFERQLWEQGLAVTDLSGEVEQLALLAVSHAPGVESDAILSALDSRFSAVREEAERLLALLDDAGRTDLRHTLLLHAARYPGAALLVRPARLPGTLHLGNRARRRPRAPVCGTARSWKRSTRPARGWRKAIRNY